MGEREKLELGRNENGMSYSTSMALDWRFEGANLANSSVGLVPIGNSMNISKGDLMGASCSSASMVDSYGPNFLDIPPNSENLGFCDINVHSNGSSSKTDGIRKDVFGIARADLDNRTLGVGWSPASSMMRMDAFLPNVPEIFPQSLSQFPTDSGFIECAARFSCFSAGNFGDMVNSYGIPQSMALHARTGGIIGLKSAPGGQSQECGLNVVEAAKNVSQPVKHLGNDGSPLRNDKGSDNAVMSPDEGKQALGGSSNEADGAESSGDDGAGSYDDSQMLDCTSGEPSIKGLNQKKRKRSGQDADSDKATGTLELPREAAKDNCESRQKGDQQPTSTTKAFGKDAKQGSQASNPPKEGYIHVRARRGQATNSHSLAERVRREKISERMKYLQDLVPGCSKVTGKAVMLDEIINYVQSLQRQVEFLSMKLATVNPHMDFNIEGLLAKDILQHRPGPSSALGFLTEMSMAFPPLYPSQPGLIHSTLPHIENSSDIPGPTIQPQLAPLTAGFKEPNQVNPLQADKH